MSTNRYLFLILSAGLNFIPQLAVSQTEGQVKEAQESAQQKLYEITGKDKVIINFKKGSAHLSEADRTELKTTLNAVKEDSKVKEILILAYADQPYPHDQTGDLAAPAIRLAEKRGEAILKRIKAVGGKITKVYNMAVKANWFEKTLTTSTAQVKLEASKSPTNQDADDAFYQALGKHLVADGGAGKAVVVVRRDFPYSH